MYGFRAGSKGCPHYPTNPGTFQVLEGPRRVAAFLFPSMPFHFHGNGFQAAGFNQYYDAPQRRRGQGARGFSFAGRYRQRKGSQPFDPGLTFHGKNGGIGKIQIQIGIAIAIEKVGESGFFALALLRSVPTLRAGPRFLRARFAPLSPHPPGGSPVAIPMKPEGQPPLDPDGHKR